MSDIKLGQLITGDAVRDALHMAVCPMVAGENLVRAQHVRIHWGRAIPTDAKGAVGIVDPFGGDVNEGETFWLVMMPGSVTKFSHNWQHPAIPDAGSNDDYYNECRHCD